HVNSARTSPTPPARNSLRRWSTVVSPSKYQVPSAVSSPIGGPVSRPRSFVPKISASATNPIRYTMTRTARYTGPVRGGLGRTLIQLAIGGAPCNGFRPHLAVGSGSRDGAGAFRVVGAVQPIALAHHELCPAAPCD